MTIEEALAFAFGKKSGTQLDEQIVMITLAREVERLSRIDKALTEYRRKERSLLGLPEDAREEDHLDAIERLLEANNHLREHGCYPENDGQTHHATCWRTRGHHECAIKRVEELGAELQDTRDAIRLIIGMSNQQSWRNVINSHVDGYVTRIRELKGGE